MRRAALHPAAACASTAALGALLLFAAPAQAFIGGVSGDSGESAAGCNGCHQGGTAPAVTLLGPAELFAGETATYAIDIVTGASNTPVGFDVAASAGTLATVTQANESQLLLGELTHTAHLARGKEVRIQFQLTAPGAAGSLTLFGAGLRSDGTDDTGGDLSANATLAVAVVSPPDGAADLSGMDAISSATAPPDAGGPPHDEKRWSCSFGGGAGASLPPLVIALALALALRRRVRSR